MRLVATSTPLDTTAPLPELAPVSDPLMWLRRGTGMVAWGIAHILDVGTGADRAARISNQMAAIEVDGNPTDLRAFISLTFDRDRAHSRAVVPRRIVARTSASTNLITIDPASSPEPGTMANSGHGSPARTPSPGTAAVHTGPGAPSGDHAEDVSGPVTEASANASDPDVGTGDHAARIRYAGSSLPDLHWLQAVADLVERIDAGDVEKVVLARDHAVWSQHPFNPRQVALRLHGRFPSCWTFHNDGLVGATPELLLARNGRALRSLVLAGTTRRDDDPDIDHRLGQALLGSDKDLREHAAAADSVVDVLTTIATDVTAPDGPTLLDLDNLRHLATDITAKLPSVGRTSDLTAVEVADLLHPTAAVGGTPRDTALALIDEVEGMDRERYAAPVGWMDATGDGEFGIALRCARLSGARARLFAGAGIVAGSLPEDELRETRLKLLAMQQALQEDTTSPQRAGSEYGGDHAG